MGRPVITTPKVGLDGFDEGIFDKPATPYVIDMKSVKSTYWRRDEKGLMRTYLRDSRQVTDDETAVDYKGVPNQGKGLLMSDAQVRARARRRMNRGVAASDAAWKQLGIKPVEEWTMEELARGVPRDPKTGRFPRGARSKVVSRAIHERAMELFREEVKSSMNGQAISALKVIGEILTNDEVDEKGKPTTPHSVKLQAATLMIEHVVGKPQQHVKQDISVKLQGILGAVMVNPTQGDDGIPALPSGYDYAHVGTRGEGRAEDIIEGEVVDDEEDFDDD